MEVVRMSQIPTFTSPMGVTARKLLEKPSFIVMNLLLKPEEVIEKHSSPIDIFFYVVKGSGKIDISNEEALVEATDIVFCPQGTLHGLRASTEEEFQVLGIKNPLSAE